MLISKQLHLYTLAPIKTLVEAEKTWDTKIIVSPTGYSTVLFKLKNSNNPWGILEQVYMVIVPYFQCYISYRKWMNEIYSMEVAMNVCKINKKSIKSLLELNTCLISELTLINMN
jgi:hypothetical protein